MIIATGQYTITDLNDGRGVSSVEAQYYLSTSSQAPTGGAWLFTMPEWEVGKYIWTRSKVTYSDGDVDYTEPYCDSSWTAINQLEYGGRNYIPNSKDMILEGTHMLVQITN